MNIIAELTERAKAAGVASGEPIPTEVDRALGDGATTCFMHRHYEWSLKYYAPLMPLCKICGGRCDPRLEVHALCSERAKRNLPIKQLDSFTRCGCSKCAATR